MQARFEFAAIYDKTANKPAAKPPAAPPPTIPPAVKPKGKKMVVAVVMRHAALRVALTGVLPVLGRRGRILEQGADHQGSREPAGGRQSRAAEGRRQQQDHGELQALPRLERRRCGAARGGDAPAGRSQSGELGIGAHRARTRDQRGPARDRGDPSVYRVAQDLSEVRAQRFGAVSAGAGLRAQCAARQGARDARSAGGELSEQPLHRRGAIPPRRDPVLEQSLPRGPGGLRGGHQVRLRVGVLQPKPLQARLVAVQAGRERAQPRFLRRRARFGARIEEQPEGPDRDRHP